MFVDSTWVYLKVSAVSVGSLPELGAWLLWHAVGVHPYSHLCGTAQHAGYRGGAKRGSTS